MTDGNILLSGLYLPGAGHFSHGLPQAFPILPQHSALVTGVLTSFSQRPPLISNQHEALRSSIKKKFDEVFSFITKTKRRKSTNFMQRFFSLLVSN